MIEAQDQALLIENVAVDPAFQGQGLGRRLMAFAEQYAREHGLRELRLYTNKVMVENLAFYRNLGFVEVERRVDDGYPACFMRKSLARVMRSLDAWRILPHVSLEATLRR